MWGGSASGGTPPLVMASWRVTDIYARTCHQTATLWAACRNVPAKMPRAVNTSATCAPLERAPWNRAGGLSCHGSPASGLGGRAGSEDGRPRTYKWGEPARVNDYATADCAINPVAWGPPNLMHSRPCSQLAHSATHRRRHRLADALFNLSRD